MSDTKMTVKNGDFSSLEQKIMVNKKLIQSLIHRGFNITATAESLGITRKTIYNYMDNDPEFRQMIESGLVEEVGQKAMMKLTHKALIEDSETAQKYLLDKSGYWERRGDIKSTNSSAEIVDIIVADDVRNVVQNLIGDFDINLEDPTEDRLQKVLRESDPTLNNEKEHKKKEVQS